MSARDEILGRLTPRGEGGELPPRWRSRRAFPDLAQRFCQALQASQGEVWRVASLAEAREQMARLLAEAGARRVVVEGDALLGQLEMPARLPQLEWYVVGQSHGDLRAFCAGADAGLSTAAAALAETGTLVLPGGPGHSRAATLLPPVHLALVPASRLTTDLFTWTQGRGGKMPAAITLVSGPSKTADIEQTMAIGVHGPGRLLVVLLEE